MGGFAVLLRKELREARRTNRLLIVGAVYLFFGIASPVTARYLPEIVNGLGGTNGVAITFPTPTTQDAVDQFLKNLGNGAFIAILLAMGLVAREKERGTAAFVLTKPAGRAAFLAAKFAALLVLFSLGIALAGAATYGYTAYYFSALGLGGFVAACGLVLLTTLAYAALTMLGSTLAPSSLPAAGFGIAAFLVLALLGALPRVGRVTPGALAGPARALALGERPTDLVAGLVGTLAVIVAALVLSWLAFRRQELGP